MASPPGKVTAILTFQKSAGREWDVGTGSETGLPGTVPRTGERVGIIILAVLSPRRARKWIRHL